MKITARAILATEQGQATIRGFIASVRESAGPKAHIESELAAELIEAQDRIAALEAVIEAAPCPASACCREHQTQTRDGIKWVKCWKARALGE